MGEPGKEKPPGLWAALDHTYREGGFPWQLLCFLSSHTPWELPYLLLESTG